MEVSRLLVFLLQSTTFFLARKLLFLGASPVWESCGKRLLLRPWWKYVIIRVLEPLGMGLP